MSWPAASRLPRARSSKANCRSRAVSRSWSLTRSAAGARRAPLARGGIELRRDAPLGPARAHKVFQKAAVPPAPRNDDLKCGRPRDLLQACNWNDRVIERRVQRGRHFDRCELRAGDRVALQIVLEACKVGKALEHQHRET